MIDFLMNNIEVALCVTMSIICFSFYIYIRVQRRKLKRFAENITEQATIDANNIVKTQSVID